MDLQKKLTPNEKLIWREVWGLHKKGQIVVKYHIREKLAEGKNKKMSRGAFQKAWEDLEKKGWLKEGKRFKGRITWKPAPRHEGRIPRKKERTPLLVRMEHTKKLQREIVEPFLEQLPEVRAYGSSYGVYYHFQNSVNQFGFHLGVDELPIESNYYFRYFMEHFPKLLKQWLEFKQKTKELWRRVRELEHAISGTNEGELPECVYRYRHSRDSEKVESLREIAPCGKTPFSEIAEKILKTSMEASSVKNGIRTTLLRLRGQAKPFSGRCGLCS